MKSLLTSLFQSVFGSVNIHIASFTSIITDLDLSNTGIHDNSLFTSSSFGNNKRSSKRLLSLECKSFGSRLRSLNLSENKLSSINNIFSESLCPTGTFVNLRELRLSYNLLSRLNRDDLRFVPYLEKLFLDNNQIKAVDEAFNIGSRMKVLDLSHNQISFLPNGIFSSGALKRKQNETLQLSELHLQNNSLRNIPSFVDGSQGATILPHLVLLNLSRNAIAWNGQSSKQLSPFASLPNLVALDLSDNEITRYVKSYCITFTSIISFNYDVFSLNIFYFIYSLSDHMFKGLSSLQVLTLANNKITTLSSFCLQPLNNLHALVLSNNLISNEKYEDENSFEGHNQLDNALKGKIHLRSLSLDHNSIKHISR